MTKRWKESISGEVTFECEGDDATRLYYLGNSGVSELLEKYLGYEGKLTFELKVPRVCPDCKGSITEQDTGWVCFSCGWYLLKPELERSK